MQSRYQPIRPQGGRPQSNGPALMERLIAAASYICGWVGFAWLLIAVITKNNLRPFLKYHIFQSLFLWFAYFVLCNVILGPLLIVLSHIPLLSQLIGAFTFYLNMSLLFNKSLIDLMIMGAIFYLVATCMQGQFSYLPWVSDIIKTNVRNS